MPKGSRIPTGLVYSSSAAGECFKVIPSSGRLKWATRTQAPKPISGRLRRTRLSPAEVKEMMQ